MGFPDIPTAKALALGFCQLPRLGRLVTHGPRGELRGRSLHADLRPDFTSHILTQKHDAVTGRPIYRTRQILDNPNVLLIWDDAPTPSWTEVCRVVYGIGTASVLSDDDAGRWFLDHGRHDRPRIADKTPEYAAANWDILVVTLHRMRLEGFAAPGESLVYADVTHGLDFDV